MAGSYWHNHEGHAPKHGRLYNVKHGARSWVGNHEGDVRYVSGNIYDDLWIGVDLLEDKKVGGLITQGRANLDQWVESFYFMYKKDGEEKFEYIVDENGVPKIFQGNKDRSTAVRTRFESKITARWFKIQVISWRASPALRFELLDC